MCICDGDAFLLSFNDGKKIKITEIKDHHCKKKPIER